MEKLSSPSAQDLLMTLAEKRSLTLGQDSKRAKTKRRLHKLLPILCADDFELGFAKSLLMEEEEDILEGIRWDYPNTLLARMWFWDELVELKTLVDRRKETTTRIVSAFRRDHGKRNSWTGLIFQMKQLGTWVLTNWDETNRWTTESTYLTYAGMCNEHSNLYALPLDALVEAWLIKNGKDR